MEHGHGVRTVTGVGSRDGIRTQQWNWIKEIVIEMELELEHGSGVGTGDGSMTGVLTGNGVGTGIGDGNDVGMRTEMSSVL